MLAKGPVEGGEARLRAYQGPVEGAIRPRMRGRASANEAEQPLRTEPAGPLPDRARGWGAGPYERCALSRIRAPTPPHGSLDFLPPMTRIPGSG